LVVAELEQVEVEDELEVEVEDELEVEVFVETGVVVVEIVVDSAGTLVDFVETVDFVEIDSAGILVGSVEIVVAF